MNKAQNKCPICNHETFLPSDQNVNILKVLERWEDVLNIKFPKSVWIHYQNTTYHQCLYVCEYCQFSMFLPVTEGTIEFYDAITAKDYYVEEKWEHRQAIKDILKINPTKLLDFGCGSGDFLKLIKRSSPAVNIYGFEYSEKVAQIAQQRGFQAVYGKFPDALSQVNTGSYNVITMFQVLEHLADPQNILKISHSLLEKSGFLIVGIPDSKGPIKYFPESWTELPPHHVSRWSASVFKKGVSALGFRVIKILYEPLPNYLWESYLQVQWKDGIWPNWITFPLGLFGYSKNERISKFIEYMSKRKINNLWGVPGHTVYVVLQKIG